MYRVRTPRRATEVVQFKRRSHVQKTTTSAAARYPQRGSAEKEKRFDGYTRGCSRDVHDDLCNPPTLSIWDATVFRTWSRLLDFTPGHPRLHCFDGGECESQTRSEAR